ncbi:hypothetical protein LguiA_010391 [Lonicera macranthoides]
MSLRNIFQDGDGNEVAAADVIKASVKELMEEEMLTEQGPKKHTNTTMVELEQFDPIHGVPLRKNHNRRKKTSMESCDIHMSGSDNATNMGPEVSCHQILEQKTSDDIDLEAIMEELLKIQRNGASYLNQDCNDNLDMKSNKAYSLVEENLSTAIRLFMNQRFNNNGGDLMENGKIDRPKEFTDALSSNKELFLKLVQDAQLEGGKNTDSNLLEVEPRKSRQEEHVDSKHRSFFRRRSKSRESNPLMENEKSQPSSRIVILKPGLAARQNPDDNVKKKAVKVQTEGKTSQFSFDTIKKKLKNAMGKERYVAAQSDGAHKKSRDSEKKFGEENGGWSSPNRNHFFTERFAKASFGIKRGEKVSKSRENETSLVNEAKKHLSEMVNNDNEEGLMSNGIQETLGRILSLPEYNFSPRSNFHMVNENTWRIVQENHNVLLSSPRKELEAPLHITDEDLDEKAQSPKSEPSVSNELSQDSLVEEAPSYKRDEMSSQGPEEVLNTANSQQDREVVLNAEETSSLTTRDVEICGTSEVCEEEVSSQFLKLDFLEEEQFFSSPSVLPSRSSSTGKPEEPNNAIDKTERPSPVSVLEPFSEDEISPASTKSQPVDTAVQLLQMQFNEHGPSANDQEICIRTCLVDEESAFEYVEAVLLASDLNWNEYLLRWISSYPPLDPLLYDEVELFSNRSCHDQKLLFDCTNEVLKEVIDRYFGCSFGKNNVHPVPKRMDLINEVWEGVEWHLLRDPPPHSLDKLLKKDLAKYKTWINLEVETENIVVELKNSILDELVEDAVLGFVNDEIREEGEEESSTKLIRVKDVIRIQRFGSISDAIALCEGLKDALFQWHFFDYRDGHGGRSFIVLFLILGLALFLLL